MSTRITKSQSEAAASKMVEPLRTQIEQKQKEIEVVVKDFLISQAPQDLINVFKKHPDYFNKFSGYVVVSGKYLFKVSFSDFPSFIRGDFHVKDNHLKDSILSIYSEKEEITKKKNRIYNEIKNTIFSLRTYKRVSEQFPEAMEFLPEKENTQVSVEVESLRSEVLEIIKK